MLERFAIFEFNLDNLVENALYFDEDASTHLPRNPDKRKNADRIYFSIDVLN